MKTDILIKFFILSVLLVAMAFGPMPLYAQSVREAVVAGKFYPAEPQALKEQIQRLTREASAADVSLPSDKELKALIMPHAGYVYSGRTAAHAARRLEGRSFSKVVIMGPDHRVGFKNGAISDVSAYETPLGRLKLHPDAEKLRKRYDCFRPVPASDKREHCIEVILPFLQFYLKDFQIVPIVFGSGDVKRYAAAVDGICQDKTLIVVSSDLSHYLPYERANHRDKQTIKMILELNAKGLAADSNRACGATAIRVLVNMARKHNWAPVLIHHENSGDTAGPRQRVVGYAAIAFYGEASMTQSSNMSEENGQLLVKLARQTIAKRLGVESGVDEDIPSRLSDDIFQSQRGTFVTLTKNDQLRGCIGNLLPDKPITEGVRENAINAAFNDPRFPELSKAELDQVDIEISLLTEPQPLEYKDADDLLSKLRPHIDGVIIRKGMHSSTFLPQVWEQLPDKPMFLSHLCLKAGLAGDEWKKGDMEVLTYQVQYFEEEK
ncbi:MAG: AmmeMemoRadiSam system protein B [Desulfobacterales bacterium]|nr:AmmeMemoRadiSam system protein B [Desulfobacterales bacterium]